MDTPITVSANILCTSGPVTFVSYPPMFADKSARVQVFAAPKVDMWDVLPTMSGVALARCTKPPLCTKHVSECLFIARSTSVYMIEFCGDTDKSAIVFGPSIGMFECAHNKCVV